MAPTSSEQMCQACPAYTEQDCSQPETIRLSQYKPGDRGTILQVCGNRDFRLRMTEMGFVKGSEVKVVKYAPLTDPVELVIKGYHVTLRRDEADGILMNEPQKAA